MSEPTKKALLDTDFLFKTQLAQNSRGEPLADLIMQFKGYDFFCHEKILRGSMHTPSMIICVSKRRKILCRFHFRYCPSNRSVIQQFINMKYVQNPPMYVCIISCVPCPTSYLRVLYIARFS